MKEFLLGMGIGVVVGALVVKSNKDVASAVDKGKKMVDEKIEEGKQFVEENILKPKKSPAKSKKKN